MKFILILVVSLYFSLNVFSQFADTTQVEELVQKESKFDKSKLYYGGYLNASFGNYTVIGAARI